MLPLGNHAVIAGDGIGVKIGQARHRQHFARVHIEHEACCAQRVDRQHPAAQLILQRALHAGVDAERNGRVPLRRIKQAFFQHRFHADLSQVIIINVSQHMRAERALWIMPVLLARSFQRQFANSVNPVGIFRQQAAQQIGGAALFQLGGYFSGVEIGKDRRQLTRHLLGRFNERRAAIVQRARIVPQGIGRKYARQRHAIAIRDLAAIRQQLGIERAHRGRILRPCQPSPP